MPDARGNILGRLRAVRPSAPPPASDFSVVEAMTWSSAARLERLRAAMAAVHTEFLDAAADGWPETVRSFLVAQGARTVALGPDTNAGRLLAGACSRAGGPRVVPYDRPVEELKATLFDDVDAGFTTVRSAIADTGSLVLWPSPGEPRLLSLVPPLHVALLSAATIRDTLLGVLRDEGWAKALPPNVLLVSGPSKTADIEQTLAYGVHGPRRLVVVVVP
jgi:L-lactate dehydrogenase complex protein LldG